MYGIIPEEISEGTLANIPGRFPVDFPLGIPGEIPEGTLEKSTETITGATSIDIPGEIPGGMCGETHRKILKKFSGAIHDGITEGSYGQIPEGIRRYILEEVSGRNS